ncbi:unnamed protein product [Cuscuta campestris]|uniref:Pectinesterase inhibitor domain-containing protein n=1 Tax=Cuscuta campestris TaxID=132261 RepID=A0A484KC22_9ASTE|nr:unnamed protein product [Cuscuta campestris]
MILCLNIAVHGGGGGVDLIHETCKATRHYRLCVSSLESDSARSNASDAKGLARIMAAVGIANATATKSYISSLLLRGGGGGETGKRLLRDCADKYSYAGDALRASIPDMEAEMYDYAYMEVAAAADYPNACHDGFRRHPGLANYPVQLGVREDGLRRICDVLLGMLDSLLLHSSP